MKEPRKDDERLSALLDGRVSGPEREELLAHLAASDEDYEVFNDAAEMLAALEEEDAHAMAADDPAKVIPIDRPRRPWRPPARWMALAAVLAGLVAISALALRGRTPAGGDPVQLAAAVHATGHQLPANWTAERDWSSPSRGGPSRERQARAAQAGAMMLRLAVAVRARDTAATRDLAQQISRRFEPGVGGATPLRQIADRPGAAPEVLERLLERSTRRLAGDLHGDYLHLGAWTQAALQAASTQNDPFFRDHSSQDMLRRAQRLTRGDAAAHAAVARVRAAIPAPGTPRWGALETALTTLLREIAS